MSASLVGSEMCIRDRPGGAGSGAGSAGNAPRGGSPGASCHASGAGPMPVSYTHLTLPTICSV
eukprot:8629645-Alexandrium_andersonii.AAC.1